MSTPTDNEVQAWLGLPAVSRLPADAIDEISRFATTLDEGTSLVATGSLVEGFGNANSDIDLYVVQDEARPSVPTSVGIRQSRYIDCEHVTLASLRQLAERIADLDRSTVLGYTMRELDRYYRLAIAIPVRTTASFDDTFALFDASRSRKALEIFARVYAYELHACSAVLLATGEERSARLFAREAALWAATERLAAQGEGYVGPKWVGEKAARRYGRDSPEFRGLVDGYLRPGADISTLIETHRRTLVLPGEVTDAVRDRALRLAPGVRMVGDVERCHLIRAKAAVARLGGPAAEICRALDEGLPWAEAVERYADQRALPLIEVMVALWSLTGGLQDARMLVAESGRE